MPVTVREYPGCCSVHILVNLGADNEPQKTRMKREIQGHIKTYHRNACALTAITSKAQVLGEQALKELGFTPSKRISKAGIAPGGTYNRVKHWHFELSDAKVKAAMAVK